jgi:YesN/AraC family two-component response regulator
MKVLIVDDEVHIRQLIRRFLSKEGYGIFDAEDGIEGYKVYKAEKPDIILSDINMPRMNGLELLEKIRKEDNDTVVVITTSMDAAEYTLKALRRRANDYIGKPFTKADIIALVKKYSTILDQRTQQREVLGMIKRRELEMQFENRLELVGKIADRLMQETEGAISGEARLGIYLGLVEMLTNAIEHGNLGITYDEKTQAQEDDLRAYLELIEERRNSPPIKVRTVNVSFKRDENSCEWLIKDEGKGFDFKNLPDPTNAENLLSSHGRGVLLTQLQFDEFEYLGSGNIVRMKKIFKKD